MKIARRIREMKIGDSFQVRTENERQNACKVAKCLRDAGVIAFKITTASRDAGGFTVNAISE